MSLLFIVSYNDSFQLPAKARVEAILKSNLGMSVSLGSVENECRLENMKTQDEKNQKSPKSFEMESDQLSSHKKYSVIP